MRSVEFLVFYVERFIRRVDSTFYACLPLVRSGIGTLELQKTSSLALKVPQIITHEKVLVDCTAEFAQVIETTDIRGTDLARWFFNFHSSIARHFQSRRVFSSCFPFLKKLPAQRKFAIEIRNKNWLDASLAICFESTKSRLRLGLFACACASGVVEDVQTSTALNVLLRAPQLSRNFRIQPKNGTAQKGHAIDSYATVSAALHRAGL
jgi:uncharacterized protein YecE (DUF72 family)